MDSTPPTHSETSFLDGRRRKKKAGLLFLFIAWILIISLGIYLAVETYALKHQGIEKKVLVVKLEHTFYPKGGPKWGYTLIIDGRHTSQEFAIPLPEGRLVTMLAPAEDQGKLVPGNRDSSLFEIFSACIGGDRWAVMVILFFLFTITATPFELIRSWRQLVRRSSA